MDSVISEANAEIVSLREKLEGLLLGGRVVNRADSRKQVKENADTSRRRMLNWPTLSNLRVRRSISFKESIKPVDIGRTRRQFRMRLLWMSKMHCSRLLAWTVLVRALNDHSKHT